MEYAYDPKVGKNLTVDEYKTQHGPKLDARGNVRWRPKLRCLVCNVPLHTVGEDNPTVVPTWGHDPSPGTFCPIKSGGSERYEILPPTEADPTKGAQLRASFFANWEAHWGYIGSVVLYPDIFTFIGFIRSADKKGLWTQRHLEEWHLPYVCLATCDFPPPKGTIAARRPHWLRFRFNDRYRTLRDLWIEADQEFSFLQLTYRKPLRKKEPGPAEFIAADHVRVDRHWLDATYPPPNTFAIAAMESAFRA
ncbi:MAG: hypothetical protein ACN6O5_21990 [Achromobacter sp.]|uniref:hypothetical protein n=1 Tax=Achromobacter sp. TaxID=134375 RepID=UPI003D094364